MNHSQPLILKFLASETEPGAFSGLGSTWTIDRHSEKIQRGAFARTIEALHAGAQHVPVLFEHQPRPVIGAITSASETDDGLQVAGKIVLGDPIADRAYKLLAARAVGLSVGFMERPNGSARGADGVKTWKDVDWVELSVTGMPANAQAVAHQVRSLDAMTHAEFKRALLAGEALPPMPRALVNKFARIAFGDDEDDQQLDAAKLQNLRAALDQLSTNFKR